MKTTLLILLTIALSAALVVAQDAQKEKTSLYTQFVENIKGDANKQKLAYEQGQEYIRKYGADEDQYVDYIRKWSAKYEKAKRETDFNNALVAKDYPKSFAVGKEILAKDGESSVVLARLVEAGYRQAQAGNKSLNVESIQFARQALALVDSGKVTDPAPFKSMDDLKGFLNYTLGWLIQENAPVEAAGLARKAAESGGAYKQEAATYVLLATAIIRGEYEPQAKEYNEKYSGKDATPEGEAMAARLKAVAERVMDSYARAVALLTKPEQQEYKTTVMEELSSLYKTFHNNSDAGLNEFIASVLTKPLP